MPVFFTKTKDKLKQICLTTKTLTLANPVY